MPNISKEVVIINSHGLHTRPVMQFVDIASRFTCEIKVHKGGAEPADADGKSVMQMIILAAEPGTLIDLLTGALHPTHELLPKDWAPAELRLQWMRDRRPTIA